MIVKVARKSSEGGAASNPCSGRRAATAVQCAASGTKIRAVAYPVEATLAATSLQHHEQRRRFPTPVLPPARAAVKKASRCVVVRDRVSARIARK